MTASRVSFDNLSRFSIQILMVCSNVFSPILLRRRVSLDEFHDAKILLNCSSSSTVRMTVTSSEKTTHFAAKLNWK